MITVFMRKILYVFKVFFPLSFIAVETDVIKSNTTRNLHKTVVHERKVLICDIIFFCVCNNVNLYTGRQLKECVFWCFFHETYSKPHKFLFLYQTPVHFIAKNISLIAKFCSQIKSIKVSINQKRRQQLTNNINFTG